MFVRYPERRQPFIEIFARLKANLVKHGTFIVRPRPKTYNKENRERKEIDILGYLLKQHLCPHEEKLRKILVYQKLMLKGS